MSLAGDWIKMRVLLASDPKVIRIADLLAGDPSFRKWLTEPVRMSCKHSAHEHVTPSVTRAVTVAGLLLTWGVASECGKRDGECDMRVTCASLSTIDEIAGVPGLGLAMEEVGWVREDEDSLIFVGYLRENSSADERKRTPEAERKRRQRERDKARDNGVTFQRDKNVTVTPREEKRREDEIPSAKPEGVPPNPPAGGNPATGESSPIPLCDAEARIRRWVGDRLSASDRHAIARAERERLESPAVTIHGQDHPAAVLFARAIDEAIASGGGFRSAGGFLKLVGTIEARCAREGCWPGEGLERVNGHPEKSTADLIAEGRARRAT